MKENLGHCEVCKKELEYGSYLCLSVFVLWQSQGYPSGDYCDKKHVHFSCATPANVEKLVQELEKKQR